MKLKKLLSVVISLTLLLSLISVPVFADGNNVAKIGDTGYETVAAAIAAADDGDVIEVIADTTETINSELSANSLHGKTVTLSGNSTITGDTGSATLYFGDFDFGSRADTDTLNVTGLNFYKNGGNYAVLIDGLTTTMTDVTINSVANSSLSFANGAQAVLENVTVANTGSHSQSWRNAALSVQGIGVGPSVLTVKSGIYTSEQGYAAYIFSSGGIVNIEGGNFSGKLMAYIDRSGAYTNDYNRSFFYISGGTFTNCAFEITAQGPNASDYAGYVITGGTFDADPTAYVPDDYKVVNNGNGTYTVKNRYVAQIGDDKYETLSAAVSAANDGDTIALIADETESLTGATAQKIIEINKNITITGAVDANGDPLYTIYGTANFNAAKNAVCVVGSKDVTISNVKFAQFGNLAKTGSYAGIIRAEAGYTGTLTVDNVTITQLNRDGILIKGGNFVIDGCYIDCSKTYGSSKLTKGIEVQNSAVGTISNTTITGATCTSGSTGAIELYNNCNVVIDNCDITSDNNGILASGTTSAKCNAVTVINNTTINAPYCVYVKDNADFTINGGEFTPTGSSGKGVWTASSATIPVKVNGTSITGAYAFYIATSTGSGAIITDGSFNGLVYKFGANTVLQISGGTFYGAYQLGLGSGASNPVISGGAFSRNYNQYDIAEGYELYRGETYFEVGPEGTATAQVGVVKYLTLERAVASAQDGATVVLLADIDYSTTYTERNARDNGRGHAIDLRDLTLDLNGHTIASINATVTFGGNGATITNGTFDLVEKNTDGSYKDGSYALIIDNAVLSYGETGTVAVENVTCDGGINICNATVTLDNVTTHTTTTKFYAIWAEQNATVTVNSGNYTDGQNKGRGIFATGTGAEGGAVITVNGGTFEGVNALKYSGADNSVVICGGTFDKDPTAYVADGYEAVYDNSDETWTVGEVKAIGIVPTTTTENFDATYTVTKQVVGENETVIKEAETPRKVNVKVVTDESVSADTTIASDNQASDIIDNLDMNKVINSVVASFDDANDDIDVHVQIVRDKPELDTTNNTITYDVHPEAIVYVNSAPSEPVAISNDALETGAEFTITLPVPDVLAAGNEYIKVTHISDDYDPEVKIYKVQQDLEGKYFVQFNVTHFSEFILATNDLSLFTGRSISLNGYIDLNFYLNLTESQVTTGAGTVVNFNWAVGSASYKIKTEDAVSGYGYKATVRVPAAEMSYLIHATVSINGTPQAEDDYYSVRLYAKDLLAQTSDAKLIKLIEAMLDYGTKAQIAFGRIDGVDYANDGISYQYFEPSDYVSLEAIDNAIYAANGRYADDMCEVATSPSIGADSYYSSSLIYLSGCTLRHYFFSNSGMDISGFTGKKSDHYYYVDKTDIAAADLDVLQEYTVHGVTFYYSALDFVKAIIYNYEPEHVYYRLAAATYWYNQAANAYFE